MFNFWGWNNTGSGKKEIKTFAFLHILSTEDLHDKNIYELCIYSVTADTLLNYEKSTLNQTEQSEPSTSKQQPLHPHSNGLPRILHKMNMVFYPDNGHDLGPNPSKLKLNMLTDNCNKINRNSANAIMGFLDSQMKPVCLVTHSGSKFVFPLLKRQLTRTGATIPRDLLCFCTTEFLREQTSKNETGEGGTYLLERAYKMIMKESYEPVIDRAEEGSEMLLKVILRLPDDFINRAKEQSIYFKEVFTGIR